MTPDREEYFMGRMLDLADIFEKYVGHPSPALEELSPETLSAMDPAEVRALLEKKDPEIFRLKDEYFKAVENLGEEFDQESEYEEHWNDLMERSGAMARMDGTLGMGP